ncbi:Glucokinase [Anaerococcus prevotii]|uniref:ROK family protein n=1 Tax=Anaerococcus prevotii (strain ATCC 9321 / DSM 20548 / JCM 6508 / NCTC 11806 / PC1) TaxID=525919 RepID=C7RHG1_ANAPD|nr:ROK family protein [Anaerococcus prevotii]ACV28922.1 ROK family protein [Anaerococcus prevotii DSM 20548]SUU94595.1 Glucokinase [Anaerococcus prevotii]
MGKVIGIDIGGTKINACLIDDKGEILERKEVPTNANRGREVVLENIKSAIYDLSYKEAIAVGIGTPGFIDSENGIVTFAGNIKGWTGLNLKEAVEEFVDVPVFVENDANIALIAEKWIGACKDYDNVVMITLGTGLGGAIYTKEAGLLSGSHFQGAELGHMILHAGGDPCTCGQKGCAESYCAGTALTKGYKKLTGKELSGQAIFDLVETDNDARKVLEDYQSDLGYLLTSLRNIFDPDVIVVGGGVIHAKDVFWDGMVSKYQEYCNKPSEVDIIPAKFLNNAGVIGAAKIAFERVNHGK